MSGSLNPHSNFVTGILKGRIDFAISMLQMVLSPKILERIDLNGLRIEDGTFIEPNLRQSRTDLLFSVPGKAGGADRNIYVLFEHKSSPDPGILLQLLKYLRAIYEWQVVKMPVVTVVLYHGQDEWDIPRSFHEYLRLSEAQVEDFGESVLNFRYDLIDVCRVDIQGLRASLAFRCFLNILAGIWEFEDSGRISGFLELYRELFFDLSEQEFVEKFLFYIFEFLDIGTERLQAFIEEYVAPEKGYLAMTTAQRLRDEGKLEGKLEGIEEGILKGKLDMAKSLIKKNVPIEVVLESSGLTKEQLKEAKIIS